MSPNPQSFIDHLRSEGYHPRSDKHSNSLARAIAEDLTAYCPAIQDLAIAGSLVYDINFTLRAGTADWNVDLVLGRPATVEPPSGTAIRQSTPSSIQIAIELKAVMTEHRKAVKNRKRDLEAHHEHVHNYDNEAIAGGVLIINAAPVFKSPLRTTSTQHRDPDRLVEHCVGSLRSVSSRGGKTGYGLEAACALVVDLGNESRGHATFVDSLPAPQVGDPLHYDSFIQSICEQYRRRFGT